MSRPRRGVYYRVQNPTRSFMDMPGGFANFVQVYRLSEALALMAKWGAGSEAEQIHAHGSTRKKRGKATVWRYEP